VTGYDADLEGVLAVVRPKLHRYCARMTGSVIDGEDVLQDVLLRTLTARASAVPIENLESWLFRAAHNAAIDFLRRRARVEGMRTDEDPDLFGTFEPLDDPEIVAASLRTFMRLPAAQRSAVILMDVLGYRLLEICAIVGASLPAVKSALHRGRERLRELARSVDESLPAKTLSEPERALLTRYIERFNAHDFDAVRDMLAEEVGLELVSKERRDGKRRVGVYFENYAATPGWHLSLGAIDSRPAILVYEDDGASPGYFILLESEGGRVVGIRDFRYARYAMRDAAL
jgi:RNA polymerase sigma-70 factor (ECF subfamily)